MMIQNKTSLDDLISMSKENNPDENKFSNNIQEMNNNQFNSYHHTTIK